MRTHTRVRTTLVTGSAVLTLALSLTACGSSATPSPGEADEPAVVESTPTPTAEAGDRLKIMVPSAPGSGWDETGLALVEALTAEGVVNGVDIVNYRGADGTVGLNQLVGEADPDTLIVVGDVLVGGIEVTGAPATLEDVTTLARLTDEPLAVVVAADSPYETITDLLADITATGQEVVVTGGPAGSADHVLAARMLVASGLPAASVATQLNYVPPAADGESFDPLFDGSVHAAIADVSEYADLLAAGSLRALAVSGEERSSTLPEVPTLREQGIDVVLRSWRGIAVAGSVDAARVSELAAAITTLQGTAAWKAALAEHGWSDAFLTGPELDTFLTDETTAVRQTLTDVGLLP